MQAIQIIHAEHNAIAAVLAGLRFLARRLEAGKPADFWLLSAMIDYVCHVPESLHHPKEDKYLFVKMRARAPELGAVLDQLAAQHAQSRSEIGLIEDALIRFHSRGKTEQAAFIAAVTRFADFHWTHMQLEESHLLPQARSVLTAQDWSEIDAAFLANQDPWSGPEGDFSALFTKIVNTVPPPYGLGRDA